jgi:hypothetical protein
MRYATTGRPLESVKHLLLESFHRAGTYRQSAVPVCNRRLSTWRPSQLGGVGAVGGGLSNGDVAGGSRGHRARRTATVPSASIQPPCCKLKGTWASRSAPGLPHQYQFVLVALMLFCCPEWYVLRSQNFEFVLLVDMWQTGSARHNNMY